MYAQLGCVQCHTREAVGDGHRRNDVDDACDGQFFALEKSGHSDEAIDEVQTVEPHAHRYGIAGEVVEPSLHRKNQHHYRKDKDAEHEVYVERDVFHCVGAGIVLQS